MCQVARNFPATSRICKMISHVYPNEYVYADEQSAVELSDQSPATRKPKKEMRCAGKFLFCFYLSSEQYTPEMKSGYTWHFR